MGLFQGLFRRGRPAPPPADWRQDPTAPPLRVGNVQGVGDRERQEDSFALRNAADPAAMEARGLLAAVCDGMGGMEDGKMASELAVESLLRRFDSWREETLLPGFFRESAHLISDEVYRRFGGRSGTTLTAVHIRKNALHWLSVGDSAIYLMRNGGVFQLNREHTYLNQLYERELRETVICKERAEGDEDARRLSSFVGIDCLREVDFNLRPLLLRSGDAVLLCSDGISGVLSPADLLEGMAMEPVQGCALIETMVLERQVPAQDNYTGILIAVK